MAPESTPRCSGRWRSSCEHLSQQIPRPWSCQGSVPSESWANISPSTVDKMLPWPSPASLRTCLCHVRKTLACDITNRDDKLMVSASASLASAHLVLCRAAFCGLRYFFGTLGLGQNTMNPPILISCSKWIDENFNTVTVQSLLSSLMAAQA